MPNTPEKTAHLFELEKHFQVQSGPRGALGLLFGLAALVQGCAPTPLEDGERRVALRETTEQVILPTYVELSARTAELAEQLDTLGTAPSEVDLSLLRQAYFDVRGPWEESQAFGFGPAVELHAQAGIDQSPIDAAKLDAELASDTELSVKYVRGLGANKRGLHAIEYLLFPATPELDALLLADDAGGQRRRQFLSAAGQVVADQAAQLLLAWDPTDGDYAGKFSRPGGPDSVAATVQAGLDSLLNEAVVVSEVLANVKLGGPLGVTKGGKVDPSAQESERSGATSGDLLANLRGVRNVYLAAREDSASSASLSSLVHGRSPSADLHARAALAEAEAALRAMPEPFTRALEESPESVEAAYESTKALKRVLATEVLGTLGASLKFSDNDGD
jgi:putative iron-regulated protein